MHRIEKDFIGEVKIPESALYGINALRASNNFENDSNFSFDWYKSIGLVKLACYKTYAKLKQEALSKLKEEDIRIDFFDDNIIEALEKAALEVAEGSHFNNFIVPAIQGGAGTAINMNINEIIANRSLLLLNKMPGSYEIISPFKHSNVFQSTNDVIPTALKLTAMQLLTVLEGSVNNTRNQSEKIEREYGNTLRIGYTQMQEAVPSSYGMLFSTYNDMLSRDWWRISKCFERIKVVNLGGGAIGTGISVPRFFIMEATHTLQKITGQPLTRSENLCDTTANLDSFVEVHAILKSHAVNLEKMANDIRLLSSDISKEKLEIPPTQIGSSVMPGKINPVIPEHIIGIANTVYANDMLITNLSAKSCLELNPFIPNIGNALIESLKLLISANKIINSYLLQGLKPNVKLSYENLIKSPVISTALIPYIGYEKATEYAIRMKNYKENIFQTNKNFNYIHEYALKEIIMPQNLLKLGFSIKK